MKRIKPNHFVNLINRCEFTGPRHKSRILHEELLKEGFFKPTYIQLAYRLSELLFFIAGLSFYKRWNLERWILF